MIHVKNILRSSHCITDGKENITNFSCNVQSTNQNRIFSIIIYTFICENLYANEDKTVAGNDAKSNLNVDGKKFLRFLSKCKTVEFHY